ncbi:MAG: biopolymer transporter ExbD [Lentisphaeria bacterium]|nr:biopolymer transporter ExbD [Lentisphaeria bacterium]
MKRTLYSQRIEEESNFIDMTPLIDVVFILLIFFIVTAVFTPDKGIDLDRPDSKSAAVVKSQYITISVDVDQKIYIEGNPIHLNDLRSFLKRNISKETVLYISLDQSLPVSVLSEVMDECRLSGIEKVSLATE